MTDILCRWLNDELKLSHTVDAATLARDFASGYLIGEVLHKYQLQDDFEQFSQSRTAESKLNNFSRLEPVFQQLSVPFDPAVARDLMTEKHGVAARVLYQLFIVLNNNKKSSLNDLGFDFPAGYIKLNTVEFNKLRENVRKARTSQTELNVAEVNARFNELQKSRDEMTFRDRFLQSETKLREREEQRMAALDRSRLLQAKQSEMVAKIKSSTMHVPKPPSKSNKFLQQKQAQLSKRESMETVAAISRFEDKLKMILLPTDDGSDEIDISYILKRDEERADTLNVIKMSSNSEYIGKIRKRLQEDAAAREEREKRRRKVIGEQLSAHQAQEEARREEMMVNKLMRQSQQERRIAVQLLQARQEKANLHNNRIMREEQYKERRQREFEEALNREAELAKLYKEENKENIQQEKELHDKIAAERAEERYRRHYDSCYDIVAQVVDFSCKVAEYRQLTENLLPAKLMRDWTAMFVSGYPLYETAPIQTGEPTPEQILEEERQMLLDEGDFMEYKDMIGEWQPPDVTEVGAPPRSNPVVSHIIQRLYSIVHPPTPPPPPPEFPPFPIRACVLGKPFSGKTTVVKQLLDEHRMVVLNAEELVSEAVEAHRNNEVMDLTPDLATREASASERPSASQDDDAPAESTTEGVGAELTVVTEEEKLPGSEKSSANQLKRQDSTVNKPSSVQRSRDKNKDPNEPQDIQEIDGVCYVPSLRNKLGSKALKFLKKGRPVDDQIVVDIIVDAIKRVPEDTGWVIDGYPQNYNQAKLLEKALSGYDANSKENMKQILKAKSRKSSLADTRPTPPPPPSEPTSGIDVIILFDMDDDVCLKRAAELAKTFEDQESQKEEPLSPREGSVSGKEKTASVSDPSNEQDHLQQKIAAFQDAWPKMDKWFTRFGTLKKVDASDLPNAVFLEVEKIMEDTVAKILGKDLESSLPLEQTEDKEKAEETPEAAPAEGAPDTSKDASAAGGPEGKVSAVGGSRSESRPDSAKRAPSHTSSKDAKKESGRDKSDSPKRDGSARKSDRGKSSRASSPKSVKGDQKASGKPETNSPEPDLEVDEPPAPSTPQPGDEAWDFADLELDQQLAAVLSAQWEGVEGTYVANCKHVFREIRLEREKIYRYFFQIRRDFLTYLRRPDIKQDFVTAWQKDYNSVPNDIRDDNQTKAELHQRVDDLREKLWSICDERKDEAERERETVMTDGWLDDRLGILSNSYITIMQAELDRFQDTVRLCRDYYKGMEGHIPEELKTTFARLPLMKLPVDQPENANLAENGVEEGAAMQPGGVDDQPGLDTSPGRDDKTDQQGQPDTKESPGHIVEMPHIPIPVVRIKIPTVPRHGDPISVDTSRSSPKDKGGKKGGKRGGQEETQSQEDISTPHDPDEKFLYDAHHFAVCSIADIMSEEMAAKKAEEDKEEKARDEKMKEREKERALAGKDKNVKKGGKKGRGQSVPSLEDEMTEEEKQAKQTKDRLHYEHYFTIREEETAGRTRLEVIKAISMAVIQDLKAKADNAFKDMNDWLGARFLKEMESIDTMSEVMRHAIEEGLPLKEQIILEQDDFLMDSDYLVLKTPSPLPVPESLEEAMPDHFTVNQLFKLYKQFAAIAPAGGMTCRTFTELLENCVSAAHGTDDLPDLWMQATHAQIEEIARSLAPDVDCVDWRRFLLSLLWPLPPATQGQLLTALHNFKAMDQKNIGFVTREQFDRTALWFDTVSPYHDGFDRLTSVKKIVFDIFADHSGSLSKLDYKDMLLYFSVAANSYEGFLRALSVATETHMPRVPRPVIKAPDSSSLQLDSTTTISVADMPESSNEDTVDDIKQKTEAAEPPMMAEKIPMEAVDNLVPLETLYKVLHHGEQSTGNDSHRFSVSDPVEKITKDKLTSVYQELGEGTVVPLTLRLLITHTDIQQAVLACKTFTTLNVGQIMASTTDSRTVSA